MQNIFIGVGVNSEIKKDLSKLADETRGSFFDVDDDEIENIF